MPLLVNHGACPHEYSPDKRIHRHIFRPGSRDPDVTGKHLEYNREKEYAQEESTDRNLDLLHHLNRFLHFSSPFLLKLSFSAACTLSAVIF